MKQTPTFIRVLSLAIVFIASSIAIHAQLLVDANDVPKTISYQGMLSSSDGTPFADGQYQITVTLYADGQGSNPVWNDSYTTNVHGGVFNVLIGSGTKALPSSENLNTPLWIGTSVNGAPEMRPLTPMTASPYALNVPDRAITADKIAEKAVTADKVDMDYIAGLEIDGQQVASNGATLKLKSSEKIALSYDEVTQTVMIDEASNATGTTGDDEKGASTLASPLAWDSNGDLTDGTVGGQATTAGDWLGTTANPLNGEYALEIRVRDTKVMRYHTAAAGTDPNVEGGQGSTVTAVSVGSTIAGGGNAINGDYDAIGGGQANAIAEGNYNTISGGQDNSVSLIGTPVDFGTVGGGLMNQVLAPMATIGGGANNIITPLAGEATIAGGHINRIESYVSAITGGHDNTIAVGGEASFIGGGRNNLIDAELSVISGGRDNIIQQSSVGSFIGGGRAHSLTGSTSTIGGGHDNTINAPEAVIAGGIDHRVLTRGGSILGGHHNSIGANSDYSTIGGGEANVINQAQRATIAGGEDNEAQGSHSTIPGGDKLRTNPSYAQIAVGFYNKPRGTMPTRPNAAQIAASNDPLFMVGNGDVSSAVGQSNAFEVSYNGHTSVYGVNGAVNPSTTGGTYVDNVIYAWGHFDITMGGLVDDFGVASVAPVGPPGVWDITLNIANPDGTFAVLNTASITVTVVDDINGTNGCTSVTVTPIGGVLGPNTFRVRTYSLNSTCTETDLPFMFKVTGRP